MRWVILDKEEAGEEALGDRLALSTNFDGKTKHHLYELVTVAEKGFDQIYQYCEGYPEGQDAIERVDYLKRHSLRTTTFYRGTVGRSVQQIKDEDALRLKIEDYLDTGNLDGQSEEQIFRSIKDHLWKDPELEWVKKPGPTGFAWNLPHILELIGVVLILISPVLIIAALLTIVSVVVGTAGKIESLLNISHGLATAIDVVGIVLTSLFIAYLLFRWWLATVRKYERTERIESKLIDLEKERLLASREDILLQNQLSSMTIVKSNGFRRKTLRVVLFIVYYAARYYWNKGKLGSIPSIHFARWVMIDKGKRLLFFSNFDNSWESYLGDFVDKAAVGLTGIWSNTVNYPKTKDLIFSGATNEEDFKKWSRYHQIPTQVWYTAYPNISVRDIINNTEIRKGLYKNLKGEELSAWLRRF